MSIKIRKSIIPPKSTPKPLSTTCKVVLLQHYKKAIIKHMLVKKENTKIMEKNKKINRDIHYPENQDHYKWNSPIEGWIKSNVDAILEKKGSWGFKIIFRNKKDEKLAA